ncbi:UPF0158 family protein [Ornithinibacillus halotolerans]|uniref:Uncharacterized protein n=1 Tax=Ornithinibacillus halotolerans TaxID=1274357 RepID=A0A916W4U2_9BACI|nr:UPF0158 family protein [Ornithinibacillus halotolerans]GGA66312.1 hypothetical protein GCM10008025_07660 [Ornithinibacillus halotolerans]
MGPKVKISDIVDGMEFQMEEYFTFLHIPTGKVVSISEQYLGKAEEGEFDGVEDLEEEERLAYDYMENSNVFVELPTRYDINEYRIIQDFCYSIDNRMIKDRLLRVIEGKGAFRRFKDAAHHLAVIQDWYTFREQRYKEIAIRFCEEFDVEYID